MLRAFSPLSVGHFSSVTLQRPPFLPALSAIALLVSGALHAEEQAVTVQDVERIEVRGDFRQTNLQKLPGSVVVLGETDIKRQSAQHLDDLLANIANLNASAGASRSRFLQMRGVGERSEFVDNINPSVGLLVDGIDYSALGLLSLADTAQLEVFRGPEATRFGANALAGMLNLQTADPVFASEGRVQLTAANYDSWQASMMVNQALTEQFAVRLVADQQKSDGFIRNDFLQREDTNGIDETTFRLKTRYQPNQDLTLDWLWNHHDIDNGYDAFSLDRNRTTLSDQPGQDKQDVDASALKLQYQGFASADSLTQLSLLKADTDYGYDEDWGYVGLHPDEYSSTDQYLRERDFMSLEQRFISKNQQGHNWVAGLYASQQTIDLTRLYTWLDQNFISDFERQNLAVYAENEQQLAPDLTLTYGGRLEQYQDEYADNNGIRTDGDDQMWGGKLSLAYQVSPLSQIYGLVSKGYKVGGVNGEALAETLNPKLTGLKDFLLSKATFAPEQLINAEFGVKGQNADHTLVSRVSAFYMWRDDMQLKGWINQGTKFVGYIDNAFSGRNYGLETENRWQLTPALVAHFSGAVLKSEIRGFVTKGGLDMSGRAQAQAPEYQFSVGADWSPLEALQISAQYAHKDGYYYSDSENIRASHSNLLNLRASYQWSQWELALWSRNLLDETYGVRGFYFGNDPRDGYTEHLYEQFGEPRRIGLTATYQF